MFDIGWGEMFLIGVVALIVVGPKDLPALFRTFGNFMGKARGMAREFQRSMEQAANESGMSEVTKSLRSIDHTLESASGSARKFAQTMTQPGQYPPDPGAPVVDKGITPPEGTKAPEVDKTPGPDAPAPRVADRDPAA